jgi:hypothetical protein
MLNRKQLFAVRIVRHMHIVAGTILNVADAIESRILSE